MRPIRGASTSVETITRPAAADGDGDGDGENDSLRVMRILAELRANDGVLSAVSAKLETEGKRYLDLFDLAPASYVQTDTSGEIILANLATSDMLGVRQGGLPGTKLARFVLQEDRADFERQVGRLRKRTGVTGWETRVQPANGPALDIHLSVRRGWEGSRRVLRWLLSEVLDRSPFVGRLHSASRRDVLTGLADRATFEDHLRQSIARARRSARAVAVIALGVSGPHSDGRTHPLGDDLVRQMSRRLRASSRDADVVCLFEEDEFALLVSDLDSSGTPSGGVGGVPLELEPVMRRIREALEAPYVAGDAEVRIAVSTGEGVFPLNARDERSLLLRAFVEMYRSRERVRNALGPSGASLVRLD